MGDELLAHRRSIRRVIDVLHLPAVVDRAAQRREALVRLGRVQTDATRRPIPDGIRLRLGDLDRVSVLGDETQLVRATSLTTPCATPPARWSWLCVGTASKPRYRCPTTGGNTTGRSRTHLGKVRPPG